MRILITGARGMLGRSLVQAWAGRHEVVGCGRQDLDIRDADACMARIGALQPEVVVHCAAHTQVDRCEAERELAQALNGVGSAHVAAACARHGARLVAISTDYVFAGDLDRAYHEDDPTGPRAIYGASKLAGEEAVRRLCPDHCIARIAWLYGPGGPSFVHTMLKLGRQEGPPLRIVDDQIGNPTATAAVADGLERLIAARATGTVHLTCGGETSWYGLAREVFRLWGLARPLQPCTTAEFRRPAPRPANSRLEKRALQRLGLPPTPTWQEALSAFRQAHPDG